MHEPMPLCPHGVTHHSRQTLVVILLLLLVVREGAPTLSQTSAGRSPRAAEASTGSSDSDIPIQVAGLSHVAAISAGSFTSLALGMDGTVWTWGINQYGQLGNGSRRSSNIPVQAI